ALLHGELELYYQPILSFVSDRIDGLEALVRWRHPRRGMIGPAEFIPLAEETGLIVALGHWVLETACAQLRDWQARGIVDSSLIMSVNVSARQLHHPTLLDDVRRALSHNRIEPR